MTHLNKKLAVTAAASALLASLGLAVAQSSDANDPMATPQDQQQVDVTPTNPSGNHIYFFRDQGNSPETDPAAHLLLIKHQQMVPVADTTSTTTTTTTVAQATPADTVTTTMPAAADTSNTEATDTTAAQPMDTTPALAPKADRN